MNQVSTPAELGAVARAARKARGWTQQEAADSAGLSRRLVNMIEGGQHPNAELWRVLSLLNALGVPLHTAAPATPSTVARMPATDLDLDAHLGTFRKADQ